MLKFGEYRLLAVHRLLSPVVYRSLVIIYLVKLDQPTVAAIRPLAQNCGLLASVCSQDVGCGQVLSLVWIAVWVQRVG